MKMTSIDLRNYVSLRLTACIAVAAVLGACAATTPPGGADDPASAQAPTAAEPSGSPSLAPSGAGEGEQQAGHDHAGHDHAGHDHAGHDHAGHQHGDAPATASGDHAGHAHAAHGAVAPAADVYTCPMHPEIRQNEPGRCSKCGMNLEKAEADEKTSE